MNLAQRKNTSFIEVHGYGSCILVIIEVQSQLQPILSDWCDPVNTQFNYEYYIS